MRWPFSKKTPEVGTTQIDDELSIKPLQIGDYGEWRRLRRENRAFLQPFEPKWPLDDLTRAGFRKRLASFERQSREGSGHCWLIWRREVEGSKTLIGGISVTNIRRGAANTGTIGYWLGEQFTGRGYMKRILRHIAEYCFNTLQLERLEAGCMINNLPSQRVLEACGFAREGIARQMLSINGRREDHVLFGLLASDRPMPLAVKR